MPEIETKREKKSGGTKKRKVDIERELRIERLCDKRDVYLGKLKQAELRVENLSLRLNLLNEDIKTLADYSL